MSEKAFEVITGGLQTTVQDLGRPGYLSIGMPIAGAQDSFSLQIGNLLVGNEPGKKPLEEQKNHHLVLKN